MSPKQAITASDALALLTGQGVVASKGTATPDNEKPYQMRAIVWDKCDACGERLPCLWTYRRPTDGKYGSYCQFCTDTYTPATAADENKNRMTT